MMITGFRGSWHFLRWCKDTRRACPLHCPLRIGATPRLEELQAASAHRAQEKEEG